MRSPPSTLSRRNAPPSGRSLANAETGVSRSASRSRTTGTSSRVFLVVAVSTTRLQTKTLARSRDEGSWCHPISVRHRWRTLCLRGHGAPFGNGGLPGIPRKRSSGCRLAGSIRAASAVRAFTSPRFSIGFPRPNRSRSSDFRQNCSTRGWGPPTGQGPRSTRLWAQAPAARLKA